VIKAIAPVDSLDDFGTGEHGGQKPIQIVPKRMRMNEMDFPFSNEGYELFQVVKVNDPVLAHYACIRIRWQSRS
jgi:hypothetical protein